MAKQGKQSDRNGSSANLGVIFADAYDDVALGRENLRSLFPGSSYSFGIKAV